MLGMAQCGALTRRADGNQATRAAFDLPVDMRAKSRLVERAIRTLLRSGIEEVNKAITQMDHVTQQNAALVEETASASESLKHQARTMTQAVAVFSLARDAGLPAPPTWIGSSPEGIAG